MENLCAISDRMQQKAWDIIEETNIIDIWESIGATVNLVGSLKMGLMMNNKDIDLHLYTDPFSLADSFHAMAQIAENPHVRSIHYTNLLDAEDQCLEWHATYEDASGDTWQIDMIHILKGSRFAGHFEQVADRIAALLTPETKACILAIKNAIPDNKKVMGIQVYQAVLADGVRDADSFFHWREENPDNGIITWMPEQKTYD